MPIIIRAKSDDHPGDLFKKFKKIISATDIIQVVKDRRYNQKPSEVRTVRKNEIRRAKRRIRSLKKLKNIPAALQPNRRRERKEFGDRGDRSERRPMSE